MPQSSMRRRGRYQGLALRQQVPIADSDAAGLLREARGGPQAAGRRGRGTAAAAREGTTETPDSGTGGRTTPPGPGLPRFLP